MSWSRLARRRAVFCTVVLISSFTPAALVSFISTRPAFPRESREQRYLISVGTDAAKVASGTIWVYSYSWYGLQKLKLASIKNGLAVVPLDTDRLKRELDPHPNTDAYVLVLEIGGRLWYRTPDLPPRDFWADLPGALNSLGRTTRAPVGETRLVLPSPARRRITLLHPDGRPVTDRDLPVSIYLYDRNHCGAHFGLPLGTFRTDRSGTIEVLAPLVALYLDDIRYYEQAGPGSAPAAYSFNFGLKLGPEEALVLRKAWFGEDDFPEEEFELRVLTAAGLPRRDVEVDLSINTNTCGGGQGPIGRTDASGTARIRLTPSITSGLQLSQPEGERRELRDGDLHTLFSRHKLTIRW